MPSSPTVEAGYVLINKDTYQDMLRVIRHQASAIKNLKKALKKQQQVLEIVQERSAERAATNYKIAETYRDVAKYNATLTPPAVLFAHIWVAHKMRGFKAKNGDDLADAVARHLKALLTLETCPECMKASWRKKVGAKVEGTVEGEKVNSEVEPQNERVGESTDEHPATDQAVIGDIQIAGNLEPTIAAPHEMENVNVPSIDHHSANTIVQNHKSEGDCKEGPGSAGSSLIDQSTTRSINPPDPAYYATG